MGYGLRSRVSRLASPDAALPKLEVKRGEAMTITFVRVTDTTCAKRGRVPVPQDQACPAVEQAGGSAVHAASEWRRYIRMWHGHAERDGHGELIIRE
jgi:hypothetical protein